MSRNAIPRILLIILLAGSVISLLNVQPVISGQHGEDTSLSNVDIIDPQPGQFANYSLRAQDPSYSGWYNVSYNEYVDLSDHVINTTHASWYSYPGYYDIFWCTVDKRTRLVTDGNYAYWNQTWYILWIETNITIGSVVKWQDTNATIIGDEIVSAMGGYIDCWIANVSTYPSSYALSFYDKQSGAMVAYRFYAYDVLTGELFLSATNVPFGWIPVSTKIYFNLWPNPATVGDTLMLEGILVDEIYHPVAARTVGLYARTLTGSWHYIVALTTDECGVFKWQATLPRSVTPNTYIFAAYFPGSERYESTYSLAALVIQ